MTTSSNLTYSCHPVPYPTTILPPTHISYILTPPLPMIDVMPFKRSKAKRSLIELILIFWTLELREGILLHSTMVIHFGVKSLPILRSQAGRIKDRIGLPAITVPICTVSLESALFCLHLAGLQVLISFTVGRHGLLVGTDVGRFGSAAPLLRLNRRGSTTQAGCGVWISVLPYL